MKNLFVFMFICAFISTGINAQQNDSPPQKFALVIGNGAYDSLGRLNNPVNDANDMAAALQSLGFSVEKVLNGNLDQMETAIVMLKNRLSVSKNSYGFFFYAGHGVQSGGVNYLIPVSASIPSENALRERAVSMNMVMGDLNDAGNALNIVVLDACRDNPFSWARSGNRGLTVVSNQPADSIIVYATSTGSVADDGTGRNGLFTGHLLNHIKTPDLEISEVFRRTGADVAQASGRTQIPAIYNQFFGQACLGTCITITPPQVTGQRSLTANFDANGAASIGASSRSCSISDAASSCTITAPTITRSGYSINGWATNPGGTATVTVSGNITLTAGNNGATYYAITTPIPVKPTTPVASPATTTTTLGATTTLAATPAAPPPDTVRTLSSNEKTFPSAGGVARVNGVTHYYITPNQRGWWTFETSNPKNCNALLEILDNNGKVVASHSGSIYTDNNAHIRVQLEPGIQYTIVARFSSQGTGNYDLTVSRL